jgi:hypothetical protein
MQWAIDIVELCSGELLEKAAKRFRLGLAMLRVSLVLLPAQQT